MQGQGCDRICHKPCILVARSWTRLAAELSRSLLLELVKYFSLPIYLQVHENAVCKHIYDLANSIERTLAHPWRQPERGRFIVPPLRNRPYKDALRTTFSCVLPEEYVLLVTWST